MNLRGFLNAVYTLFIEASMALGKDVFTALEEMQGLREPATANGTPPLVKDETAQNDASLAQLMGMIGGVA